jgi:PIN domain nuclease of toxin-antitoxin system
MKLLLDTHAFIWWDSDPAQLSAPALAALRDPANEVWLSVASVWEMVIKAQLGKLTFRQPLADIVSQQQANGLRVLSVALAHALGVEALPAIHKDPFDRVLIVQANVEGCELISADPVVRQYPVRVLWQPALAGWFRFPSSGQGGRFFVRRACPGGHIHRFQAGFGRP